MYIYHINFQMHIYNQDMEDSKCVSVIGLSTCHQPVLEAQLSRPKGWCSYGPQMTEYTIYLGMLSMSCQDHDHGKILMDLKLGTFSSILQVSFLKRAQLESVNMRMFSM